MQRTRSAGLSGGLLVATLVVAACGGGAANPATGGAANPATGGASVPAGSPAAASAAGSAAAGAGKDITDFDACSVVSDADLAQAISGGAADPSALGTIAVTHAPVDGTITGLPGAKACKLSWTTTDSAGRQSQGGDPVVVTFDLYSNLDEILAGSPANQDDYASVGAVAFDAPGDAGDPHLTKDGYLFRMSGNSDLALLKAVALGIASRL